MIDDATDSCNPSETAISWSQTGRGSGRVKVEDEIVDLAEWDATRFGVNTMRSMEAGPNGIDYLAFGAGDNPRDAEMAPNWWSD